ncbi:MAG: site-specific DNA-methyltransferase [Pirellulales bacterium]|nr:site-specific DNA-methyltransferase [Pirellulales bacterium]
MDVKQRAPRNRTLYLEPTEVSAYSSHLVRCDEPTPLKTLLGRTANQDIFDALPNLPSACVDLLIADPPYNLDKEFNGVSFRKMKSSQYEEWVDSWLTQLLRLLKPTASVYVCCDWKCSSQIQRVLERHLIVRNRITWEREKGRGAKTNWKNASEDIWFATVSNDYYFDVDAVKLKRKVIAPYTANGRPKDWDRSDEGNFRLTHPSNLWTDISVPFWSMPENTDHPTQKPEKLIAKLMLASSQSGDVVFDPFLGVGTTSVVAKKLNRQFFGVEIDEGYCCLAEKRLELVAQDASIQGYADGVFWERNSLADQPKLKDKASEQQSSLF